MDRGLAVSDARQGFEVPMKLLGGQTMLRIDAGSTRRYCDGLSRRSFLQLGIAGMASVGLPGILRAKAESAGKLGTTKDTSVILIWLDGGPSHLDLYDMKPEAPAEYRGLWKPIRTRVPGFDIRSEEHTSE